MPGAQLNVDAWVNEYISPYDIYQHGIKQVLFQAKTQYQDMWIVDSQFHGKALVLDGKWQSCTGDEFMYHEPLVHPACVLHGSPQRILILGGGEGATVREALKWNTVTHVAMVDIDGQVVEACKRYLPEMHQGAFDDPRTELIIGDALDALNQDDERWDVIISDLSDPIEEGPSFKLFTQEYFAKCKAALAPGGYLVVQAGPTAPPRCDLHVRLINTLDAVFENAVSIDSPVPSYASSWGYGIAHDGPIDVHVDAAAVDAMLAEKTTGSMRMFDGRTMLRLMHPPKYLRDAIAMETRVYSMQDVPKFFGSGVADTEG